MDDKPDLISVLQHYGADTYRAKESGWSDVKCPFHDDRTASARVNIKLGRFRCFACDMTGDAIDLIMTKEGLGFGDACRWAREHVGYKGVSSGPPKPERYRPSWSTEDDDS